MSDIRELVDEFFIKIGGLRYAAKTERVYQGVASDFVRWCDAHGVHRWDQLRPSDFRLWASGDSGQLRNATVRLRMSAIRSIARWGYSEGISDLPRVCTMKLPRKIDRRRRAVTEGEVEALLGAVDGDESFVGLRTAAVVNLIYATGMRISEVAGLQCSAIAPDFGEVVVYGKGDRRRVVPIVDQAQFALIRWDAARRQALSERAGGVSFFVARDGCPIGAKGLRRHFSLAAKRAGLPEWVTPHKLRHAIATHLHRGGADLRTIQAFLGHESLDMTAHYVGVDDALVARRVARAHPLRRAAET